MVFDPASPVVGQQTGPELIDEIGREPTLDRLMQRDLRSKPAKDEELTTLVNSLRRDRATMILKDEKKSAKKQGVDDATEENDDTAGE